MGRKKFTAIQHANRLAAQDLPYLREAVEMMKGKSTANDTQQGGSHYKDKAIQPWDYIVANGLGYLEGNVVKYVSRWKDKNGIEDLKKARHYLDKLIEISGQGD